MKPGSKQRFSGKVGLYMGQKTLDNPVFEDIDEERVATGRLSPVYRLTEGLTNNRLRGLIYEALENYVHFVPDPLPESIRETYGLLDLPTALAQIHFPDSHEQLEAARRRLAFEELFYIQLGVQQRRALLRQAAAEPLPLSDEALAQFCQLLPFDLTAAQRRVLEEIRSDLARAVPMTRLVQGDVGSGKTIVAAELEIERNQMRRGIRKVRQGAFGICCFLNDVAIELKALLEQRADGRLVVDHEYSLGCQSSWHTEQFDVPCGSPRPKRGLSQNLTQCHRASIWP